MENNRGKRKKFGISELLILLVFLVGLGVLGYPTVSDLWNRYRNSQLISGYSRTVGDMDHSEYEAIFREAQEYNRKHRINEIKDTFQEEGKDYVLTHPYDQLLNPTNDGIMGYISIPKIHIELAVYHGTGADVLEKGVGHVEGTSLPVGGEGTHTVLAGHRGLPNAKLFTDLDQMEEGDLIFLHVLDQILAYRVDQILTVLPDELDALAIEEDKDYMTLLTCTPYGVNTHRLLVRGVRTDYEETAEEDSSGMMIAESMVNDPRTLLLLAGIAVFLIILIFMLKGNRKKEKKNG